MTDLSSYRPYLDFIREQEQHMTQLVHDWSLINSGSYHLEGLARMLSVLKDNFLWLDGTMEVLDLPEMEVVNSGGAITTQRLGQALRIRKRPDAPLQVFLCGHYDTVFGKEHPFQTAQYLFPDRILNAPGAADLKGGLVVMLKALEALEKSPWAERIGWEILLNPDEEIGSPGSRHLLAEAAARNHLGLVYEPSLPDGTLVSTRKGSGNFTVIVRGRAAHAGREFEKGINAIAGLAEVTQAIWHLNGQRTGVTINPGKIEGGGALNIVPDLAILRFNVRVPDAQSQDWLETKLAEIVHRQNTAVQEHPERAYTLHLHGGFTRPPKELSECIRHMQAMVEECGAMLGLTLGWQASGGCCDGNNLAAAGLPNIDTLGVRGGNIHSAEEYVLLDSLVERAQLSALLLMRLAQGELEHSSLSPAPR